MLLGGSFFVLVHTWSWSSDVERCKMRSQRFGLASEDFLEANDRVLIELVRSQTSTYSYLLVDLCKGSYAKSPPEKSSNFSHQLSAKPPSVPARNKAIFDQMDAAARQIKLVYIAEHQKDRI